MLTFCNGRQSATRRDFLTVGALGIGGLTLGDLLRIRAQAAPTAPRQKAVIFVYLFGGPSHLDTFDMKPAAPEEYRGEFSPIRTNVPGIEICELLPRLATVADKLSIVRNLAFNPNFHDPVELFTGHRKPTEGASASRPDFGSVISRLRVGQHRDLPPYIALDRTVGDQFRNGPAYLGQAHKAFIVGEKLENFSLHRELTLDRLRDRAALARQFDQFHRAADGALGTMEAMDQFTAQALEMVTSTRARDAFDVSQEPESIRALYGAGDNLRLLQARRLVEAGVPVVTLTLGSRRGALETCAGSSWDTHRNNFKCLRVLMPQLDQAVHALLTDLHQRGLDQDVVVYVGGEMGRTPKVGQGTGNGATPDGRDHWVRAGFGIFSGGGLKVGQVVGATDKLGGAPVGPPYKPQNMLATLYHVLGVDPTTTLPDFTGRPLPLLDDPRKIAELV